MPPRQAPAASFDDEMTLLRFNDEMTGHAVMARSAVINGPQAEVMRRRRVIKKDSCLRLSSKRWRPKTLESPELKTQETVVSGALNSAATVRLGLMLAERPARGRWGVSQAGGACSASAWAV